MHQYVQLVAPGDYQRVLVWLVHEQEHLEVDPTCEPLRQRGYWFGWKNTVKKELGWCANCAQYYREKPPRQAELQLVLCGTQCGRVAIDIIWKYSKSRSGYEYILSVMDCFAKWAKAYPISDHKATTVASVLLENYFTRLRLPEEILSDG